MVDVLDSLNKYRDDIRVGRCRNNRIQLGLPAATTKAPSQVQGYGLYSRAEIPSGDFIGEYTGEVISISEGDRRGAMYHVLNQEYLFVINKHQEIDASNHGNKMRFMNNSQRDENINVEPKKLWCSGVVRVGLFAKRYIQAGEEMLYNYNYPESVVKNFWEPGEKPAKARRMIPHAPQERVARITGDNKFAEEKSDGTQESSQSPLVSRHPKRKRPLVESPDNHHFDGASSIRGVNLESSADEAPQALEVDDLEDSDYESHDVASEDGDADDNSDEGSGVDSYGDAPEDAAERQQRKISARRMKEFRQGLRRLGKASAMVGRSIGNQTDRGEVDKGGLGSESESNLTSQTSNDGGATKRKRKIGPNDKRFGGKAQQRAWQTRRLNGSQGSSPSTPLRTGQSDRNGGGSKKQ